MSQGRLESLLNFQTMIADLTGLPFATASLLDEGSAAAEAMNMAYDGGRLKRNKMFVSSKVHPQTIGLLRTRAEPLGIELVVGNEMDVNSFEEYFAVMLQYPATLGSVSDGCISNLFSTQATSSFLV